MKTIAFFSSDFRQLYKSDVYRSLALPKGYIIHFRYQKKYIEEHLLEEILTDIGHSNSKIINQEGIIFFTSGTDPEISEKNRTSKNISIRQVKILKYECGKNTDLIHFYLELGDFVNLRLTNVDEGPVKFVSRIDVNQPMIKCIWTDRVEEIKESFIGALFVNVDSINDSKGQNINPRIKDNSKNSLYELIDDKEYSINLSFYDVSNGNNAIKLEVKNDRIIALETPGEIRIQAPMDDRSLNLTTIALDVSKSTAYLRLITSYIEKETSVQLEMVLQLNVIRRKSKSIMFGGISAFAFLALAVTNAVAKLPNIKLHTVVILIGIMTVFFGLATAGLYSFFNKK